METIVNKVAESDIEVFDLDSLWDGKPVVSFDLAPFLYQEMLLKEKDFREAMKSHDWPAYEDRHVAIHCSVDAIVPIWAYMLVASRLQGIAASTAFGEPADLVRDAFTRMLDHEDWSRYRDKIVVVKGCSSKTVPTNAYLLATQKLQTVARKLMYGEPCSSVPLWRRPKS